MATSFTLKTIMAGFLLLLIVGVSLLGPINLINKLTTAYDKILGGDSKTDSQVISDFSVLKNNYKTCFDSKNSDCVCKIVGPSFSINYRIVVTKGILSLEKRKGSQWEQLESSVVNGKNLFTGKTMNCYLESYDIDKKGTIKDLKGNAAILSYEVTRALEDRENVNTDSGLFDKYYFFYNNIIFYKKDNQICFVVSRSQSGEFIADEDLSNYITTSRLPYCT
ncbi:MAG: hypothetical protein WC413_03480 [Candidatus Nanoarchaeia archaeon]